MKLRPVILAILWCCVSLPRSQAAEKDTPSGESKRASRVAYLPDTFKKSLNWQGISFKVTWPAGLDPRILEIIPSGLSQDNSKITRQIQGAVIGAVVDDLDSDNSPEIYIFVKTKTGTCELVAYTADHNRSLAEIQLRPPAEDGIKGYRGGDQFKVADGRFVRTIPIYLDGDADGKPTGGQRQIHYKLLGGKGGWTLRKDQVVDL